MGMHTYAISPERKGYSRHEVDRLLRNLDATIDELQSDRSSLMERMRAIETELEIANKNLIKAQAQKPTFSGLGSKFEEVLRTAEVQAEHMLEEAKRRSESITVEAEATAQRLLRSSEEQAEQILNEAQRRAKDAALQGETAAVEVAAIANARLGEASEAVTQAKRDAANIRSVAENEIMQLRQEAQQHIDQQREEIHRLREETEHHAIEVERMLLERQAEVEAQCDRALSEATERSAAILDQANLKAAEINERAYAVGQESEALHERLRREVEQQHAEARKRASELIEQAKLYSNNLVNQVEMFSDKVHARAQARLEALNDESEFIRTFIEDHRVSRKTETVIAQIEEHLRQASADRPN